MKFRFLLICLCMAVFASVSHAAEPALFCPALRQVDSYGKGLESYKTLVEGTDGWAFRSEDDLRPHFELKDNTIKLIAQLQENLEKQGITFVMLYPPTRGLAHHAHIKPADAAAFGFSDPGAVWSEYESMIAKMSAAGIHVVGIPRTAAEGKDFFYKQDHHWDSAGAKISADALAAYIKKMPVYAGLEKISFVTAPKGTVDYKSSWDKAFKKICGTKRTSEKITRLETSRTEKAVTENDLFGDATAPQVILAGTSNSTPQEPSFANFEGFLKESLSTDILNLSVAGAGIDTGLLEWLSSDQKKSGRGKLVIWEVPGNYELDRKVRLFRQVIPAVAGDCGDKAVKSVSGVPFTGTTAALFSGIAGQGISGADYYIYVNFTQPLKQNFIIHTVFQTSEDKTWVSRSQRAKAGSEYALLLKSWKEGPLDKVSLEAPAAMYGVTVNAKICKLP